MPNKFIHSSISLVPASCMKLRRKERGRDRYPPVLPDCHISLPPAPEACLGLLYLAPFVCATHGELNFGTQPTHSPYIMMSTKYLMPGPCVYPFEQPQEPVSAICYVVSPHLTPLHPPCSPPNTEFSCFLLVSIETNTATPLANALNRQSRNARFWCRC